MTTEGIDRRLHRLHDDDLSPEERAALEQEIAATPELGKKLDGLREVGVVLRAARTDDAPIDSDALWKAIESKIAIAAAETTAPEAETTPVRPGLRAIDGGAAKHPPVEDSRARRRRLIGITVGAFAIAAAALFVFYGTPATEPETVAETTPPATTTAPEETAPPEETTVADASDYTEVLAVDFGTNVGTIFAVEGEGGQRYAVVWLDDVLKHDETEPTADTPATPD